MRNYLILVFLLSGFITAYSQSITGKIYSETGKEPLPGAIVIADDSIGITADSSGGYLIKLSPGRHKLEFRMISFTSEIRNPDLKENESLVLNVNLHQSEQLLNIVVISASKFEQRIEDVTVSMEVLKPKLIESRNAVAIDEAADYIPGVNIMDGQANIRGGSGWSYGAGSRVQVLVDDLPQLTADANDAKWNFLPIENLEQIEVIKGASSVLFGSSALNGVINIRTAYPRDIPMTKINFFGGVYDKASITTDKKYSVSYSDKYFTYQGINFFHSRKIKRWDFVVGGNYLNDNGYRQGENERRGRINFNTRYNTGIKGLSVGVNFNTMVNDETVFFLWKNDTSGAYMPAYNTLSDAKAYRTNIDPFVTYIGPQGSIHKLRTRWFNSTNKNNTDQDSKSDLYYAEYQYQKNFKDLVTISAGVVNNISIIKSELYGDHDGVQHAGYVQADFRYKRLKISAGARIEDCEMDTIRNDWTPVFRAGLNYQLAKGTFLRASAGQGYRFPSPAERFIRTSVGGLNIFPNPELQPESGVSYEIGLKQLVKLGNWQGYVDAAVFQNEYHNMMEFVFAQWGNNITDLGFKSFNIGDTRIKGFEISFLAVGKLPGDIEVEFQGGYTYLNPKQITYDSAYVAKIGVKNAKGSDSTDFLKYRYKHMIKGDLSISRKKISVGSSIRYTSRMENIDAIFVAQPNLFDYLFPPGLGIADYRSYHNNGDWILDLRAGYDITKNIQLSFIVKNVTNHIYMQRPADMQPPRTFVLQGSINF